MMTSTLSWKEAVHRVSDLAHAKLPEALHGTVERATALVLHGGVWLEDESRHALVRGSDGATWYPVNGHCTCLAAPQAPEGLCKHRLAVMLYRRAAELCREGLPPVREASCQPLDGLVSRSEPTPAAPAACPEAMFSACLRGTVGGIDTQLTARGQTLAEFTAHLQAVRALFDAPSAAPQAGSAPPPPETPSTPTPEGWCLVHGVQMKRNSNERGSWWSHKAGEQWCRGKAAK